MTSLPNSESIHALIVAAGRGQRFGGKVAKQYTQIAGQTVLQHSVAALAQSKYVNDVMIVVAADDNYIHQLDFALPIQLAIGGTMRWQSVKAGVDAIMRAGASGNDLVLIHDAARPCINSDCIDKVVNIAQQELYGAILGTPVTDTLKKIQYPDGLAVKDKSDNDVKQIVKTIDRSQLWQAQTPQVFRLDKLKEVLAYVDEHQLEITDEASAFEALNYPVKIVQGDRLNIKLTYPIDIKILSAILELEQ